MTYEEIEEKAPEEFAARKINKLTYRYPRGESYVLCFALSAYAFRALVEHAPLVKALL